MPCLLQTLLVHIVSLPPTTTAVYRKRNTILLYVVINSPVVQQRIPPRPLPDLSCRSPECVHLFPLVVTICTPIPSHPCRPAVACVPTQLTNPCACCVPCFVGVGSNHPPRKADHRSKGGEPGRELPAPGSRLHRACHRQAFDGLLGDGETGAEISLRI